MENTKDAQAVSVGMKIRSLRKIRRISLQQLAEEMSMSYSFLSGLENGKHSISLTNLQRFASYFDVDMIYFLQARKGSTLHVRASEAFDVNTSDGIGFHVVSPENSSRLQVSYVCMPAHPKTERHVHKHKKGQELITLLEGRLIVMVEDEKYELAAGDSVLFESEVEHVIYTEDVPAKFMIVSSPPYGQNAGVDGQQKP
ncbi:MAG: XRE family transcriptional regulator [Ruthenibacterium sp.]